MEGSDRSPFIHIPKSSDVEEIALDHFRRWQREHKTPVLVILENLGTLFERQLRDRRSQSRLREILTRDPPFALLGTATSYTDVTVQHAAPFYDFFQTLTLEDLSRDEVAELVAARARWDNEGAVPSQLDIVHARIHAVFHFCGGNPRLALALYSILKQGHASDLHTQLLKLLDEVTPYYQQRLADISPQMGRVLVKMALAADTMTPADIARYCRIPTNHVTANVTKLVAEHLVRPVGRPDKRRRFYDLNDRLFRLWIQTRDNHTARQRLRFLSEFFQHWYEDHSEETRPAAAHVADVSLAVRWAERRKEINRHTIYHLLLGLLEASDETIPSFTAIVQWITAHVPQSELNAVFVERMPDAARKAPSNAKAILRAYKALRDLGALPSGLIPYSAALEASEEPDRIAAFSPELREAVELLVGTPHPWAPIGGRTSTGSQGTRRPRTHLRPPVTRTRPPLGGRRDSRRSKPRIP